MLDIGGGYPGDRAGFEAPGHSVKRMSTPKKFAARSGFRSGHIFLASHNYGSVKNGVFPTFQVQAFSTESLEMDRVDFVCRIAPSIAEKLARLFPPSEYPEVVVVGKNYGVVDPNI